MKLYTTKIVAQYLDLSERRVRQLRDEGVLEEKAPGLYDLRSSVRRYINYLRGDEGGKADLNEERAKLTKEKRIAAETENKVRNGELYRKSDITVGMTTVVMNLRSRLLACPTSWLQTLPSWTVMRARSWTYCKVPSMRSWRNF